MGREESTHGGCPQHAGFHGDKGEISEDVVEVVEGISVDVTLPEPVDVLVSETIGAVASEEGLYATYADAQAEAEKLGRLAAQATRSYELASVDDRDAADAAMVGTQGGGQTPGCSSRPAQFWRTRWSARRR